MNCVFFWSEEHARSHRRKQPRPPGEYMNLTQAAGMVRLAQAALFGLDD